MPKNRITVVGRLLPFDLVPTGIYVRGIEAIFSILIWLNWFIDFFLITIYVFGFCQVESIIQIKLREYK